MNRRFLKSSPLKVIIVDDSAVVRNIFHNYLNQFEDIEVVATASDPYVARDLIVKYHPDVVTLDIEMPRMDGLTFLRKLMKYYPLPVIIVSSLAKKNNEIVLEALASGAVDVVAKPGGQFSIREILPQLVEKIRVAASVDIKRLLTRITIRDGQVARLSLAKTTNRVIAIGASTGGTEAIKEVLKPLPRTIPPIVIVQHMPPGFTASYANTLNELCEIDVKEAENGDQLVSGKALLAPGDFHMIIRRSGASYFVQLNKGPKLYYQRPSVEALFSSVAAFAGKNAIGIILTGMGKDGARGLLEMRESGSRTIAQDRDSSVVFGMPKEAIEIGAAEFVLPLQKIPEKIVELCREE